MEGIHLRGGAIARGGIRFSDRMDYRTEVYGLMRAQLTKNAIIVPAGAKGGFIVKRSPIDKAVIEESYVTYIRSLLDVTDNLVDGEVVHPARVRVRDDDDTYLVVAADKGTATFSDTANAVARRVRVLARRRVRLRRLGRLRPQEARHHRARGVGVGQAPLPRAGGGRRARRVHGRRDRRHVRRRVRQRDAAVGQDPAARRLRPPAHLHRPGSGCCGVVRGAAAAVRDAGLVVGRLLARGAVRGRRGLPARRQVGRAVRRGRASCSGSTDERVAPNEVIRAVLRAQVDLLWNGGIGTVVKASAESDADAHDRASDAIRVDARELRCRVVGEGGNLGFTRRARVEYAAGGGRIYADFIDNSAGVDCSDHEVNLKILLGLAERRGEHDARRSATSCWRR